MSNRRNTIRARRRPPGRGAPMPVRLRGQQPWRGPTLAVLLVGVGSIIVACGSTAGDDAGPAPVLDATAQKGQQVAQKHGCASCHTSTGGRSEGPSWKGIYGQPVTLVDGSTVTVDDAYIARSIQEPSAQIAAGYNSRMPKAVPPLTDDEIAAVTAYIEALA